MSEFVGTDRGIRRLAVTPVRDAMRPVGKIEEIERLPTVDVSGTLHDALAAMLTSDSLNVVIVEDGKPVGTVHIAVVTPDGTGITSLEIPGSRDQIRDETVARALALCLEEL